MSGFPSPGRYTVQAVAAGGDLVASLYAVGGDIYIGNVSVLCSKIVSAYAVVGIPVVASSAIDVTRSGNIDTSAYTPPLRIPIGQSYSILWAGGAGQTASMSVTVVGQP